MSSDGVLELSFRMKETIALLNESNDRCIELYGKVKLTEEKVEIVDDRLTRMEKLVSNIDLDKLEYFNENFDEMHKDMAVAINIVNVERGMHSMMETGNKEIKPTGIIAKRSNALEFKPKSIKQWYTDRMNDENDIVNIPTGLTFRKWILNNKGFRPTLKPNATEKEIIDSSYKYMESDCQSIHVMLKESYEEYKNKLKIAHQSSKETQI